MRALAPVAVLAFVLTACGGGDATRTGTPAPSPEATTERATMAPTADDPLAGETLEGEPLSLSDFRGKYLFVNVWSSW